MRASQDAAIAMGEGVRGSSACQIRGPKWRSNHRACLLSFQGRGEAIAAPEIRPRRRREHIRVASYAVNKRAAAHARRLIERRQYVVRSDWGDAQPKAADQDAYLAAHTWEEYAAWHLGLTEGAGEETKGRYAFVYGDFRRVHRSGLIACVYRAASGTTRRSRSRHTSSSSYSTRPERKATSAPMPRASSSRC